MTENVGAQRRVHDRLLEFGITVLAMGFLVFVTTVSSGADAAPQGGTLVVPGSGLGPIPDRPAGSGYCGGGFNGPPLNVIFDVPSITGFVVRDVDVRLTFSPVHMWAGDVVATLFKLTRQHVLFGRVGATTDNGCGNSAGLSGPYIFSDAAVPPSGGFWQAARVVGGGVPIASGSYFTTNSGGVGASIPMPPTSLAATFAGMSSSEASGLWTLRFVDFGVGETGSVSAASLVLYLSSDVIFRHGFDS